MIGITTKIKTRSSASRILGIPLELLNESRIAAISDEQYVLDFVTHRSRVPDPRVYCVKTIQENPHIYEVWKRYASGPHYITSARSCSCPSWAWQEEYKDELRQHLPSFIPLCKHQSLVAKLVPMPLKYSSKSMVMWADKDGCTMTWISEDGLNFEEYKMLSTPEEWLDARNKTVRAGWHWNYASSGVATKLNKSTGKYKK